MTKFNCLSSLVESVAEHFFWSHLGSYIFDVLLYGQLTIKMVFNMHNVIILRLVKNIQIQKSLNYRRLLNHYFGPFLVVWV